MRAHLAYLVTVLRHKFLAFRSCLWIGVPLWIALMHDVSKFSPVEWAPYVHHFYNADGTKRGADKHGSPAFQRAWLHHQRNLHHWQAWISIGDYGEISPLPIPEIYLREMVADWIAAGEAYSGKADPVGWYAVQKYKMNLHDASRDRLEQLLREYFPGAWLLKMTQRLLKNCERDVRKVQ